MPSNWPSEALKVQAVAARTYALTSNAVGATFDLYRDTRSQMYGGVAAETPATDAAVADTRAQVVTYSGAPVVTYFSASSGGHTENVENVWPAATPEPWLRGVPDPYDGAGGNPNYRWTYRLTAAAATKQLGHLVKGRLLGIRVTERGSSPRIMSAQVVGTGGTTTVTGDQLQHVFGLLTTYAEFTAISALPGQSVAGVKHAGNARQTDAAAVVALVPLVQSLVSGTLPALHGTVFPGRQGEPITVQEQGAGGWQTVAQARLGAGGRYGVALPSSGTYRVVYQGLPGAAVWVP
jgi:stage II sporulation protein D